MNKIVFFVFLFLINSSLHLFAQDDNISSTRNEKEKEKEKEKKDTFKLKVENWHLINDFQHSEYLPFDTAQDNFHVFNILDKKNDGAVYLNNIGTPYKNLWYFADNSHYDFLFDQNIANYLITPENIMYYRTNKPYTLINYASGSKKINEQTLNVLNSQNINKRLNFGLFYNLISSKGQLSSEKTRNTSYGFFTGYNGRHYTVYANVLFNKVKLLYNGGVPDTITDYSESVPVRMENVNSVYGNQCYFLTHKWSMGKEVTFDVNDSTQDYYVIPKVSISHTVQYNRKYRAFRIPDYPFGYPTGKYESDFTYDSVSYNNLSNTVALLFNENPDTRFNFRLKTYITHEFTQNDMYSDSISRDASEYNHTYLGGTLYNFRTSKWAWYANAKYCILGNRRLNDFEGRALLSRTFFLRNDSVNISISGILRQIKPSYNYEIYLGNNVEWKNSSLHQISEQIISASLSIPAFRLKAGMDIARSKYNMLVNEYAVPYQDSSSINVLSVYVKKDFYFWKFRWLNKLTWQENDYNDVLHLPKLIWNSTLRFDQMLFKVLDVQIGVHCNYQSSYKTSTFEPASGFFFLQNSHSAGDFFLLDGFADMKIRKVCIFLKYTNLLNISVDKMYFSVKGYPINKPTFYFGVAWRFYD